MLGLLEQSDEFVVHFLEASQTFLSEHFAVPDRTGREQFEEIDHTTSDNGVPLIEGVLARLTCTVESMYDAGDHVLVLGLVRSALDVKKGSPLLYYDRRYLSVD
jgi:3-hydroxy-9,10-secoandrosta-1,3,5(10)-triene-9,17-dione monooxygenase reductase component